MPLTRIDSAFVDLDNLGGITFDDQAGTPTFKVDAVNHRVGIGTASPSYKLQVEGDIKVGELGTLWFSDIPNSIEKIVGGGSELDIYADALVNFYESDADTLAFTVDTNSARAYFEGDTNTYWHHPAADTHAFVNNGSTSLYINSGGNVGIGTSSPQSALDVVAPDSAGISQVLRVKKSNAGDACVFRIDLDPDSNIVKYAATGSQGGAHVFGQGGAGEYMRIDSNGKVGIGTDSPDVKLHVEEGTAGANDTPEVKISSFRPTIRLEDKSTSANSSEICGDNALIFRCSVPVDDDTALTEHMRINALGNVGIGTDSPASTLDVFKASDGEYFRAGSSNTGRQLVFTSSNTTFNGDTHTINASSTAGRLILATADTGRVFIDSSGKVGIGTSSPSGKLEVRAADATQTLNLVATENVANAGGSIHFYAADRSDAGEATAYIKSLLRTNNSGSGNVQLGDLVFGTQNTDRMLIDEDGKVGINTTNPGSFLTIESGVEPDPADVGGNAKGSIYLQNVGGTPAQDALGNAIGFSRINTSRRGAMIASYQPTADGDQCGLAFYTRGSTNTASDAVAQRMVLDHSGAVGINTSTPENKLHVVNNAITGAVYRANATLTLENNGATELHLASSDTGSGQIRFGDTQGNYRGAVTYDHSNDEMLFVTDGNTRARIDVNGNVGIGTSSPENTLDVAGSIAVDRPSNYWNNHGVIVFGAGGDGPIGEIGHHAAFELSITSNGYRNDSAQWTSHGANSQT